MSQDFSILRPFPIKISGHANEEDTVRSLRATKEDKKDEKNAAIVLTVFSMLPMFFLIKLKADNTQAKKVNNLAIKNL